jgi:hypothetical protein
MSGDSCSFSTPALVALLAALQANRRRKAAEKLAAERTVAAYGEQTAPDITIIAPVGAGPEK